jgi:hypothetical protein
MKRLGSTAQIVAGLVVRWDGKYYLTLDAPKGRAFKVIDLQYGDTIDAWFSDLPGDEYSWSKLL